MTDYGSHHVPVLSVTEVYGQGKLASRAKAGTMGYGTITGGGDNTWPALDIQIQKE